MYETILDTIGKTPLVRLNSRLVAKVESFNPGGSVKDRIALLMIEAAEEAGVLKKGMTIVEPTSGNTGIGLALVAAVKGYKTVFTMPASMSVERQKILKAFGAEIVLVLPKDGPGMTGAIKKAKKLAKERGWFQPQQFDNPMNPAAHIQTTGPEILEEYKEGNLGAFVAGVGTGGTITGVGKVLKERFPGVKIVAVEPLKSPVLSGGDPGPHAIQGIGAGFVPGVLNINVFDEIVTVENDDAIVSARELATSHGIFAGISSGANFWAAKKIAEQVEGDVVFVICDTGERYLSTVLWGE